MPKPKKTGYLVCDGATCKCSFAKPPSIATLKVKSQDKYLLGNNKKLATTKDNTKDNLDFGDCLNVPDPTKPLPCKGKIKFKWEDYYENVEVGKDGLKILLDISTGKCKGYKGNDATITIFNHGQGTPKPDINVKGGTPHHLTLISPLVPSGKWAEQEHPSVTGITMTNPFPGQNIASNKSSNSDTVALVEIKDYTYNLSFKAQIETGGDTKLVSWVLYSGINRNKIQVHHIEWGSSFTLTIGKSSGEANYRIEAYGTVIGGDDGVYIDIELKKNKIETITGSYNGIAASVGLDDGHIWLKGTPCLFIAKYTFHPLPVYWYVSSGGRNIYMPGGIDVSNIVKVSGELNTASITFMNNGKYTVQAMDAYNNADIQYVQLGVEETPSVIALQYGANHFYRTTDHVKIEIVGYNLDNVLIKSLQVAKNVYWTVAINGRVIQGFQLIQTNFNNTPNQLAHFANLPSALGAYIVTAHGEHPTIPATIEGMNAAVKASYYFNVCNNRISYIDPIPATVVAGATTSFKANAIMEYIGNEKSLLNWAIDGPTDGIPSNTPGGTIAFDNPADKTTAKITVKTPGTYTVSCSLNLSDSDGTAVNRELVVAKPVLKRALWCYDTGYKRTETGYKEQTDAFVEIAGLGSAPLDFLLQVWLLPPNMDNPDSIFANPTTYMAQELPLALNYVEANRSSEGYVTITTDDTNYKAKVDALLLPIGVMPSLIFTIAPKNSGAVTYGADVKIEHAQQVVTAANKLYYKVLDDGEVLQLTTKARIQSIVFSTEDKKDIQRAYTTYGKTHQIWVHTNAMVGQKLMVKVFGELPHSQFADTYSADNKTVVISEEAKKDEQTVPDTGVVRLDFALTDALKNKHIGENIKVYTASVFKTVTDAQGNKVVQLVADQYRTNAALGLQKVYDANQKELGIYLPEQEKTELPNADTLKALRQKFLYTNNDLKVAKVLTTDMKPGISPVVVEYGDVEGKQECPRCKKITLEQLQALFKDIEDKGRLEKSLPVFEKALVVLGIDTCLKKAHFSHKSYKK